MKTSNIEILLKALEREKKARKEAESILEEKSKSLLLTSNKLSLVNQKLETLLEEKSLQLRGVIENINDAYVVIDLSGNILKMNNIAKHMFHHFDEDRLLNIKEVIHNKDEEYSNKSFKRLQEKGSFTNFTPRIITKNKKIKWVQINATLIYDKNKETIGAQGIVRDVSNIKKLEFQKEKILKELENRNNQLLEYAHIVSHDLKSPLRSLHALVSWIKLDNENKFDEITSQNFLLIEETLQTMDDLISSVLKYSSAGYESNELEKVDTKNLLSNLIKNLYIPNHIKIDVQEDLPIINAETTKIQQIFQNLISNAIRFINKEVGLINIQCEKKKNYFEFSISDNGIGIDEKYHKKIFNIFQSLNKSKESTGVGLSIVKKIVNLYGGEIWLESKLNEGTTFFFTIKTKEYNF